VREEKKQSKNTKQKTILSKKAQTDGELNENKERSYHRMNA